MIRAGHVPGCPKAGPCTCPPVRGRRRAVDGPVDPAFLIGWHVREARKSQGLGLTGRLRRAARRLAS